MRAVHAAGVARLIDSYRAIPTSATVRLAKPTSNLFRARARTAAKGLDTSGLTGVIAVDETKGFLGKTIGRPLLRVVWRDPEGRDVAAWWVADLPGWRAALEEARGEESLAKS